MNDIERYNFWNIEMDQYLKDIKKEKKEDSLLKVIKTPKEAALFMAELDAVINLSKND